MSYPVTRRMRTSAAAGLRPWAIVEIAAASDESQRVGMIRAAYHLSAAGLVALALRGVTRHHVDRALDPVVDTHRDRNTGVVYLDADETKEDLLAAATYASVVIACTEGFRAELARHGIRAVDARDGAQLLSLHEDQCFEPRN